MNWRHGDVHIEQVRVFPTERREDTQTKEHVLAYGELTGHRHWIQEHRSVTTMFKSGDDIFFEVGDPVTIDHQEHGRQKLPAGRYRAIVVREVDHLTGLVRRVAD